MVRFIIYLEMEGREYNWGIYIPIWLDLLYTLKWKAENIIGEFTFQYG